VRVFLFLSFAAAALAFSPAQKLASQAKAARKPADKIRLFSKSIKLEPSAQAYAGRALACRALGENEAALSDFNHAAKLLPGDYWIYLQRARALAALGRFAAAEEDFSSAIRLDAACWPAYNGRAAARAARGAYDEAVSDYSRVINHASGADALEARKGRSAAFARLGMAKQSREDAARLKPETGKKR